MPACLSACLPSAELVWVETTKAESCCFFSFHFLVTRQPRLVSCSIVLRVDSACWGYCFLRTTFIAPTDLSTFTTTTGLSLHHLHNYAALALALRRCGAHITCCGFACGRWEPTLGEGSSLGRGRSQSGCCEGGVPDCVGWVLSVSLYQHAWPWE